MARHYGKFGIDANQPIDGSGNVAARLQNPDYIANTGVHWLRLNMVLPRGDFLSRYDAIIDRYIDREMKLIVAVGQDALGDVPLGDKLRDPNSTAASGWIQQYVQRFLEIVERYRGKVFVYEAVNEPNGWQGGGRALIHPRWFVYLMNTLYQTVRPQERGIRLISGPLEATWLNDNEAARYLQNVLDVGGWASGDVPWDGVGYHIYVGESPEAPPGTPGCTDPEQIRATYATYLAEMWAVMRGYDPQHHHKLFVTEFGWTSDGLGESYQTRQLQTGLDILAGDERVAVASIFCTEDFARKYGLYVQGMSRPKQAFGMVRQLMTANAPTRTRHVNFAELEGPVEGYDGGEIGDSLPWSIGPGLMHHPVQRRGVILLPPYDDGRWARAVLDSGHFGQAGVTITWSPGEAGLSITGEQRLVLVVNPTEWGTADGSLVPWFREQFPGVLVREEQFASPAALTGWLLTHPDPFEE